MEEELGESPPPPAVLKASNKSWLQQPEVTGVTEGLGAEDVQTLLGC